MASAVAKSFATQLHDGERIQDFACVYDEPYSAQEICLLAHSEFQTASDMALATFNQRGTRIA
jgi:hypothetical protein